MDQYPWCPSSLASQSATGGDKVPVSHHGLGTGVTGNAPPFPASSQYLVPPRAREAWTNQGSQPKMQKNWQPARQSLKNGEEKLTSKFFSLSPFRLAVLRCTSSWRFSESHGENGHPSYAAITNSMMHPVWTLPPSRLRSTSPSLLLPGSMLCVDALTTC